MSEAARAVLVVRPRLRHRCASHHRPTRQRPPRCGTTTAGGCLKLCPSDKAVATKNRQSCTQLPGLVALPQPVEHPVPGPRDLRPLGLGQRVGPDHCDPPPAVEHRLGRCEIELDAGSGERLGEFCLESGALVRGHLGQHRSDCRAGTLDPPSPWSPLEYPPARPPSADRLHTTAWRDRRPAGRAAGLSGRGRRRGDVPALARLAATRRTDSVTGAPAAGRAAGGTRDRVRQ